MPGTNHIDESLTDDEREALLELAAQEADTDADDPLFNPSDVVAAKPDTEVEGDQEELTPEEQAEKDEAEALAAQTARDEAATKAAAEAAGKTNDEPAKPEPVVEAPAPRAPILVAEAPEDADARLADIASRKAALSEKFDDGDLTSKEFQTQVDALNKEERALERQIDKAQIAQDLENQRLTNERMTEINTFLKEVEIPNDNKNLRFNVLNTAVIAVANDEANINLTPREVMQKAYDLCVSEGALQPKKSAEPAKPTPTPAKPKTPINAPPTLANLPAAEINNTDDNRFAYLNRIANPDIREREFAKLSPADQEAYLATGG